MADWLPPIQSLRAFVAAVRKGNFSSAGEALNLTHGAVSHHVSQLEHLVGTKLFNRHRRGVVPTRAAEELAWRVSRALDDLQEAIADARGDARRSLTITLIPALAQRWLVPRLAVFQEMRPELDIRIRATPEILDLDVEGIDIALRYGSGRWRGLTCMHIADEWLFPVVSPSFNGGSLPRHPKDLAACVLIQNPKQPWEPWFECAGLVPVKPKGPTVDDAGLALDLAIRGQGVALARSFLAMSDLASGRLVRLFREVAKDRFAYWLVMRPGLESRPDVLALVEWVRCECDAAQRAAHVPRR